MREYANLLWSRRIVLAILLAALIGCVYLVLEPFFASIAWALLLAYITWPAYKRFRSRMREQRSLSALLAVTGLGITIVLPLLLLVELVQQDLLVLYQSGSAYLQQPHLALPDVIADIPWVGAFLHRWLIEHLSDSVQLEQTVAHWLQAGAMQLILLLGGAGKNAAKFAFALITLFFFYRDGESVLRQVRSALHHFVGDRIDGYINAAGTMSRVIVQSALLAALLQGAVAGLGYWLLGIKAPALLGVATAIASVIPLFGTMLVWGPAGILLIVDGEVWHGIAMLAWGIVLIHPVDNIIRPLLVSNAARIPFLFSMFGALGGIAAFGLIGFFIGPILLAVALAIWREWISAIEADSN